MFFTPLTSDSPRVSKHSRPLELLRRRRPWKRVSHSSSQLLTQSSTNQNPPTSTSPLTAVGPQCSRKNRRAAHELRDTPSPEGIEASRRKGSKHCTLWHPLHGMEKLKRRWRPRAGWVVQKAAVSATPAGKGQPGHYKEQTPR